MLEEDSFVLRGLAAECKDAKERERLRALYALSIGQSVSLVTSVFCVDDATVYRWVEKWREERSLADGGRPGRPLVLDEKDRQRIRGLVDEGSPKKHGVNAGCWGTRELRTYFAKRGKVVSRDALRVTLKRMGARYVKAVIEYEEADEQERLAFAKQFFEDLRRKPKSAVVLFEDEMSANCSARRGYGWTFKKRLVIRSHQRRKHVNCFGAVNPLKGETVQTTSECAKTPAFIRFLHKLLREYPRKTLWVYLDGGPVHKAQKVQDFLERHPRLQLRPLPPYSPDVNPREQWHNYLREKFLDNHPFENPRQLAAAISGFTRLTPPETIMSVCSLEPIAKLLP